MEATQEIDFLSLLLPLLGVIFTIAVGVFLLNQHFHKNLYRQRLKQEALKREHHQQLLKSSIHVQESERKRIARDLHDELGATLSITRMHLMRLEQTSTAESSTQLQNVRSLVETTLASIRKISHELMPPQLEVFGLVKTLNSVIGQLHESGPLTVVLNAAPDMGRLPWEVEVALYRISMELLQNTLKHAGATQAEIFIHRHSDHLAYSYSDNGKGLPPNGYTPGLGLQSVEARVNALNGHFEISNQNGLYLQLEIPLA